VHDAETVSLQIKFVIFPAGLGYIGLDLLQRRSRPQTGRVPNLFRAVTGGDPTRQDRPFFFLCFACGLYRTGSRRASIEQTVTVRSSRRSAK